MKKILVLVASETNLPVIKAAKRLGFYVITCDNNENNIGHKFADDNIFIDVYDHHRILERLKNYKLDAVVSFVSAHGLNSASVISQKLGLKGYNDIDLNLLLNKCLFRDFLKMSGLNYPVYQNADNLEEINFDKLSYPSIVKPANQGGSKGVNVINSKEELVSYFNRAELQSDAGSFIIEEFLQSDILINGDCIVHNGKIVASIIGDYIFDKKVTSVIPVATLFPSKHNTQKALDQLNSIIRSLEIPNGIINFEAIIKDNRAFIIEINPRPSGNYLWKLMSHCYELDIPELYLKLLMDEEVILSNLKIKCSQSFFAYQLFYSSKQKKIGKIDLPLNLQNSIIDLIWFYKKGDTINSMNSLYNRAGIALFEFKDEEQKRAYLENLDFFKI